MNIERDFTEEENMEFVTFTNNKEMSWINPVKKYVETDDYISVENYLNQGELYVYRKDGNSLYTWQEKYGCTMDNPYDRWELRETT